MASEKEQLSLSIDLRTALYDAARLILEDGAAVVDIWEVDLSSIEIIEDSTRGENKNAESILPEAFYRSEIYN